MLKNKFTLTKEKLERVNKKDGEALSNICRLLLLIFLLEFKLLNITFLFFSFKIWLYKFQQKCTLQTYLVAKLLAQIP